MTTDRYGRTWTLSPEELCEDCGQPDNCGDCEHDPVDDLVTSVQTRGAREVFP